MADLPGKIRSRPKPSWLPHAFELIDGLGATEAATRAAKAVVSGCSPDSPRPTITARPYPDGCGAIVVCDYGRTVVWPNGTTLLSC